MIDITYSQFFDRSNMRKYIDAATIRVLSKGGSHVRQRAKSIIRTRKKSSAKGQPPNNHTGLLKQFIFFAYDRKTNSVVVGPNKLNAKDGTAPGVLERGGTWTNLKGEKKAIAPRPYMRPALEAEAPKMPELFRNAIR